MSWHRGEDLMHQKLQVPSDLDNPSVPMLSQQAARTLQQAPLFAVGTVDADQRPWTSIWGGESGFSRPLGQSIIGVRTPVAATCDPVVEALVGSRPDGGIVKEEGSGRMISGLTIDLAARKRVKLYGRMVAGALSTIKPDDPDVQANESSDTEIQLVMRIEQSLGPWITSIVCKLLNWTRQLSQIFECESDYPSTCSTAAHIGLGASCTRSVIAYRKGGYVLHKLEAANGRYGYESSWWTSWIRPSTI